MAVKRTGTAFFYSLLFHGLVIAALIFSIAPTHLSYRTANVDPKAPPVQAIALNDKAVAAEVARIKEKQAREKAAEVAKEKRMRALIAKAKQAERQRIAEQKRLATLKAAQLAEQRKQAAAAAAAKKRLAAVKKQQQAEAEKLSATQKANQAAAADLAKKQAAIDAAKAAEQAAADKAAAERKQAEAAAAFLSKYGAVIDKYRAAITQAIAQRWIIPAGANRSLACRLEITVAASGAVLNVVVLTGSGDEALDRSAVTAVYKASPLPVPQEPEVFDKFKTLRLTVRPEGLLASSGV